MQNIYLFFDYDELVVNELKKQFSSEPNVLFWVGDCRQLIKVEKVDIIVSPANSSGYMDGGIDYYLNKMFPGIEKKVQNRINSYKILKVNNNVQLNRMMLPIGSAFITQTDSADCPELICAPTMEDPDNIQGTENVFYSFYGVLKCAETNRKHKIIAVPGWGTGTGEMTPKESASEMKRAWQTYMNKIELNSDIIHKQDKDEYILNRHAC